MLDANTLDAYRWARERARCEQDYLYLAATYLHVKAKDQIGLPTLRLNAVQRRLHEVAEAQVRRTGKVRLVVGKPRQVGCSVYWQSRTFHQTAFADNRNAIMIAHDEPAAVEIFSVTKGYYDALPPPLKPRTRHDAKMRMVFDGRNSKILSAHAANVHVAIGQMNHIVHMTEAARYPHPEQVWDALAPQISQAAGPEGYSMVVIESTSWIGGEWFKAFAEDARAGRNEYEFLFIPWFHHHAYTAPVPRGFQPTAEERELKRQYHLTDGQLVWRRQAIANFRANPLLFQQSYPNDWESSWVLPKGAMRVFQDDVLDRLHADLRPPRYRANALSSGLVPQLGGLIEVWEPPQPDVYYDMGVDIAGTVDEHSDWTVACVIRRDTYEQVAQFRARINPASQDFIDAMYWLGMAYHTAQICPDITGGWGNALLTELQMRSYPNLWQWRRRDDAKQRISSRVGYVFTKREKAALVSNAVALATRGAVVIRSETLWRELRDYLAVGLDEWAAAPGAWDDTVTAWMLALIAARDERLDAPAPPPVEAPAPAHPWAVHDIDHDLAEDAERALIPMDPWG